MIYGLACYQTFLMRPAAARRALFRSLDAFRARVEASGEARILLSAHDLGRVRSGGPWTLSGGRETREAFFLAIESMRFLSDPADVRRLWDLGVRSLQPIHFLDTPWGGSSREGFLPESRHGLSGLGREMLSEMARLGLILDLAHMSRKTAEDCLAGYPGPVMCSHTGLHEIKASPRNLPAELAREVFRRRGLVGVTCWRHLLGASPQAGAGGTRASWTRAYCATAIALASLADGADGAAEDGGAAEGAFSGVAVGSDRGAPIRAPAWFFSPDHLLEIGACFSQAGWDTARIDRFLSGNGLDFLSRSLPATG